MTTTCRITGPARGLAWVLALAAGAAPAASAATAAPGVLAADAAATTPCHVKGVAHEARCGHIVRPLDPARTDGPTVEIHFAVVPAVARHKASDAVFFLAGGPGQSAIDLAGAMSARFADVANRRDLVFVDQRGTGRSAPLKCPDDDEPALGRPLAALLDEQRLQQALAACRAALQRLPHGDLRQYTTAIAMADLDAVRQHLGYARIDLVGGSYGTRAALEYLRRFPQAVRRAVIDGVAPADMVLPASFSTDNQAALDALFDHCERDADCQQRFPGLRAQWQGLLATLPREVRVTHPLTGRDEILTVTRGQVLGAVRGPLYVPALAAGLPAAIVAAARGRFTPLFGLGAALGGGGGAVASGMHFSVVCAEDVPRLPPLPAGAAAAGGPRAGERTAERTAGRTTERAAERARRGSGAARHAPPGAAAAASTPQPGADFGEHFADVYRQACAQWPRGAVPEDFYTLVPTPVATLVLSGGLDPVTPPRHGQRVAQALGPRARHVVVPNAGHGTTALACLRDVVQRFISVDDDAQALALPADCASAMPRPGAFVPPGLGVPERP